jgi:hypothetical protein
VGCVLRYINVEIFTVSTGVLFKYLIAQRVGGGIEDKGGY